MEKSYWFCLYLNNLLNAVWEEKYLEIENYRFTENNIAGIWKEGLSDLNPHIFKTFWNNNFSLYTTLLPL